MVGSGSRGQALSIEGLVAAVILLGSVGFALQATIVTPLSSSTSNQHVENQLDSLVDGTLRAETQDGELRAAVLYWNPETAGFYGTTQGVSRYRGVSEIPGELALGFEQVLFSREIAYSIRLHYQTESGRETQQLLDQGSPTDNAVSGSQTVVLRDSDRLRTVDGSVGMRLRDVGDGFYAPDISPATGVYNVIEVEVIAWRI